MSYTVKLHTDNSRPDNSDHRLVVISYKTPAAEKDNPHYRKQPTLCLSIPKLIVSVEPTVLAAPLTSALYDLQNQVIRDLIDNTAATQRVGLVIPSSAISSSAITAWFAASSGRLSGDTIDAWFTSDVADALEVALAKKLGITDAPSTEELLKLSAAVEDQRLRFKKLAGPQTRYPAPVTNGLLRTLDTIAPASELKDKLTTRLKSFLTEQPTDLLISL